MTSSSCEKTMTDLAPSNNNNIVRKNGILPGERYQCFAFPDAIMHYIAMNPLNAKVYSKLIQTCKYFYNKNPILVVRSLGNGDPALLNRSSNMSTEEKALFYFNDATNVRIDMDKLPCKIWITKSVAIMYVMCTKLGSQMCTNVGASLIQKIYRCDADIVQLSFKILTLDELLLLASNASKCNFFCHEITENDGKGQVAFEKVIEKLTKLREIRWVGTCGSLSANTVKELLKIPHFGNISSFTIKYIDQELFDAKALFDYVKTKNKNMKLRLYYDTCSYGSCSAKFKKEIEEIVDEIIGTEVFTYMPPVITDYYFIKTETRFKMEEISGDYADTRF